MVTLAENVTLRNELKDREDKVILRLTERKIEEAFQEIKDWTISKKKNIKKIMGNI